MKRMMEAAAGGILFPILLLFGAIFAEASGLGGLARILTLTFMWPLLIYSPIFPPPPECLSCEPTMAAILVTMLCDFIVFSLLSYGLFYWRDFETYAEAEVQTLGIASSTVDDSGESAAAPAGTKTSIRKTLGASICDEDRTDAQTFTRHSRAVR